MEEEESELGRGFMLVDIVYRSGLGPGLIASGEARGYPTLVSSGLSRSGSGENPWESPRIPEN